MQSARFRITVDGSALFWQGQTLEGAHGWDPAFIHPSPLNHALCKALGVGGIRGRLLQVGGTGRLLHHSLVFPQVWAAPAAVIRETLRPIEVTLVSGTANYGRLVATQGKAGEQRVVPSPDGRLDYADPTVEMAMGRPKRIVGWSGAWEGRIFRHDKFEVPDLTLLTLGPLAVEGVMERLDDWAEVETLAHGDTGGPADHLVDPVLIPEGVEILEAVHAMPWSLARLEANAKAGTARVFSVWHAAKTRAA